MNTKDADVNDEIPFNVDMRVKYNGKNTVGFYTGGKGSSFWLFAGLNQGHPSISLDFSGNGHTSVEGRYSQDMTLDELGEFLKHANALYDKLKK